MPTIDIRHLQELAERTTGKTQLGELIRHLIYASVARCQPNLHFLAGETNGYPGWDGWAEVSFEQLGQPQLHRSIWELSTDRNFTSKFRRDYKSARSKPLPNGWKASDVIYVGITLRSVTSPALASIRRELIKDYGCPWAGIVLLAADDVVQWLEKVPSVEAWAAEEFKIGVNRFGRALEHWFSAWSQQANPNVSENLLMSGRDLTSLQSAFRLGAGPVTSLQCDSVEEATALVYCAAKSLPESDSRLVLSSTLVVVDDQMADRLADQPMSAYGMPTVILAPPATKHSSRLEKAGFRVFQALGRRDDSSGVLLFERASVRDFATALSSSMRVADVQAEVEARACGCSVSIWHIRNLFRRAIQPTLPEWVSTANIDAVIAAVFAGAWHEPSAPDMGVMSRLAGMDEVRLSGCLAPFAACTTPLLEYIGPDRLVIAPTAAFEFVCGQITRHHVGRLAAACTEVFGSVSPAVQDRWQNVSSELRWRHKREELSEELRDGLAETLLRIAVLGSPLVSSGALAGYTSAQSFVDHLVRDLPGLSHDVRVLASLNRQLPDLMEAAPTPFLDALEALIQGLPDQLHILFADEQGIFGRSFHTGLLWGLEGLAWSPDLLPRVAQVLAALCRIDPGGQLSNRPFRSLSDLFLAWHPGTASGPEQRADVVRSIVQQFPDVGWLLVLDLLPWRRRTATPTHRPKWRSFGQEDRRSIRRSDVVAAHELYVDIALQFAGADVTKLCDLVADYPALTTHQKSRLEEALRRAAQSDASPADVQRLWTKLQKLCSRHRSFPDADWAMPDAEVVRLQEIADGLVLTDPVLRHRWLFDEQFPDLGNHDEPHEDQVSELDGRRRSALRDILHTRGWDGVDNLVSTAQFAYIVGNVVGVLDCDDQDVLQAMNAWQERGNDADWLAFRSAASSRFAHCGNAWSDSVLSFASAAAWPVKAIAMAFVDYPDKLETYELVSQLPPDCQSEYWTRRFAFIRGARDDIDAFRTAVNGFIAHDRAFDLIDQNWSDLHLLGYQEVLAIVDAFVSGLSDGVQPRSHGAIDHDVQHVFDWLRRQPEANVSEIAKREYSLLPLLMTHGDRGGDLSLHQLMREQPQFFTDLVCHLYKAASRDDEPSGAALETARTQARAAFELLESWKSPPGVVGDTIDKEALTAWVTDARAQLLANDREAIGDEQIGKLLYHLPNDPEDGAYPPGALRALLEHWRSAEIERGIEIECFNSRGVTSRAMFEGGRQERDLETRWKTYAVQIGSRWPRSVALCKRIAEVWRRDADAQDLDAKHGRAKQSR